MVDPLPTPTIQQIHRHASARSYRPDPVPAALVETIVAAGQRASTSSNLQMWSVLAVAGAATRQALAELCGQQEHIAQAPLFLAWCADLARLERACELRGYSQVTAYVENFLVAAVDTAIAMQNAALAAESLGLGICYMGSTLANCDQIGRLLALPPGVVPVVGFSLGWPAEDPAPRDRLPLDGLIHYETYHDYSDADIAAIYAEREHKGWQRYMSFPTLRALIEESGVTNLAQVYTTVKYTRESHLAFSATVRDYLRQQGFDDC